MPKRKAEPPVASSRSSSTAPEAGSLDPGPAQATNEPSATCSNAHVCTYKQGLCLLPRALKKNGDFHSLCQHQYVNSKNDIRISASPKTTLFYHHVISRVKQNEAQKKSDLKHRQSITYRRRVRRTFNRTSQSNGEDDERISDPATTTPTGKSGSSVHGLDIDDTPGLRLHILQVESNEDKPLEVPVPVRTAVDPQDRSIDSKTKAVVAPHSESVCLEKSKKSASNAPMEGTNSGVAPNQHIFNLMEFLFESNMVEEDDGKNQKNRHTS